MKVVDCFTFFNELDLLEFRLRLLDEYVDLFVIAESNLTHSGVSKEYNYAVNKERFTKWVHKIVYLPVHQSTEGLTFNKDEKTYNPANGSWVLENQQRDALKKAAEFTEDTDIVIIGDLDEIPNPAVLQSIKTTDTPVTLQMRFHYYFMNCMSCKGEKWWNGSVVSSGKDFKQYSPQVFRDKRNEYRHIKNAGWHFSYLGGVEKIKQKINSFAHTEFNKAEYLDDEHIIRSLQKGKDVFNRRHKKYRFVPLAKYPPFLQELMKQYPQFIKETTWLQYFRSFFS